MELWEIARIGLLFLDGDDVSGALIDKIGPTDYDFDRFNSVKRTLLGIERMFPEAGVCAVVWTRYAPDSDVVIPLIAGSSLTPEGSRRQVGHEILLRVLATAQPADMERSGGARSHYAPIRDSNGDVTGVLELIAGLTEMIDVSYRDMYSPRRLDNYVEPEVQA